MCFTCVHEDKKTYQHHGFALQQTLHRDTDFRTVQKYEKCVK